MKNSRDTSGGGSAGVIGYDTRSGLGGLHRLVVYFRMRLVKLQAF
jgi:hypothetical protein